MGSGEVKSQEVGKIAYCNEVESCQELAALEMTIERQELGITEEFKEIVVDLLRDPNFDLQQLVNWASGLLKDYGIRRNLERKKL